VDMIIKAAGQMPFKNLVDQNDVQNRNGKIVVKNNATNIPGLFAGGDCVNGGKEVVDAVQAGKDGAKAIQEYLGVMNSELSVMNETDPSAFNSLPSGIPNL
ncbi:MAG: FAD-dependent oxidoreductase, partial [Flavisolibacter sp.]|nr:FAD-dependent oxidoreductase [Flavisolibacter sp.]